MSHAGARIDRGRHVQNSLRLILAAPIVGGVTYAAAGAPPPSSSISAKAEPAPPPLGLAYLDP